MNRSEDANASFYKVVVNHEEQYSIWPVDQENPLGWRDAGKTGPKAECLYEPLEGAHSPLPN